MRFAPTFPFVRRLEDIDGDTQGHFDILENA